MGVEAPLNHSTAVDLDGRLFWCPEPVGIPVGIRCCCPRSWRPLLPSLSQGAARARLHAMPSKDRATHDPPEKPGGEGWLVMAEQQLLCQFKPDSATVHAQWVGVRTYKWVPPYPPVPQTRRRMLRHNAIEAWETMLKTGWRRCSPPVR